MDIVIREMKLSDIDRIMEIEKNTFPTPWSREAFELEIKKNLLAKYLVAEIDNYVVGYSGIWLIIDEGHITNIAVEPAYRGRGVGNKLLEGLIQLSSDRNIRALTLEVRESNKVAQALYRKHGFSQQGIRPGYYSDNNEDAIIMWKSIPF